MSTVHFTSDLHFYHANIIKYSNRPFSSVEDMNESLVENWNKQVRPQDAVYSLGDFGFSGIDNLIEILKRLNGTHHMVLGNHDKQISANRVRLLSEGLVKEIRDAKEITFAKQKISMHHYAGRTWNGSHYGSWMLFGHTHGTMPPLGKSVDVGADSPFITGKAEYRPFSFDELKQFMDTRPIHDSFGAN